MNVLVLTVTCLVVLGLATWVSQPIPAFWRWAFRGLTAATLLAMVAPPWLIEASIEMARPILPLPTSGGDSGIASILVHFLSFALLSGLLLTQRRDLGRSTLLAALAVLSVLTESLQLLVEGRHAGPWDVAVNLGGAAAGSLATLFRRQP